MKRNRFIGTGVLLLLFGTIAPAYAMQEHHEQEAKPEKQEQQAKPEKQQQHKAPQQAKNQARQQKQPQQARAANRQPQKAQQQAKPTQQAKHTQQPKPAEKQQVQRAKPAQQQKTQQVRANGGNGGGGAHGRISDAHYRASFGSSHRFHVSEGDFRNHRFQWGGYSFGFVDPWPVGWLYTDDVYVDYVDGGYYMFDVAHPGIHISINIV